MPPYGPHKYDPLTRDVAAILRVALPPSARTGHFWVNATRNSPQARAWRRAGWRVATSNVSLGAVTFVRDRPDSTA